MKKDHAIELINVTKVYGSQYVLNGVNLSIPDRKTTVIVGGSGQGKSQIIKHILGLVKPDSGKVMVFGREISRVGGKELREIRTNFGVLFQNVALFDSMTVYDNVALPLRERTRLPESEIKKIVDEKLEMMDVVNSHHKFPPQISGGMKKRVGLARALVLEPRIIFFDEPTTGLDAAKSSEIYRVFYKTQAELGYTAVIVSHDMPRILKLADYVALLDNGTIHGCITTEEFQLSDNPVIRRYVESTMGPVYSSEMEGEL